ncbi:MAG: glycosyl hydrolase 115 family protein [bacterium]
MLSSCNHSNEDAGLIAVKANKASFPLAENNAVAPLYLSKDDHSGVLRVAGHLQNDLKMVTGNKPVLISDEDVDTEYAVIIGSLDKSSLIEELVSSQKIDLSSLEGKRETFIIQSIDNPFPEVEKALVIAGSDKRGTIYGMYHLSEKAGVSPWYWWADVPVKKSRELHVLQGPHTLGEPKVELRGIFINDEAPALSGWAHENFGGFNHEFYDHVFELILRLKGNFLWPAMWGRAIYDDDSISPELADEYGVVIGTSHHEPLMRAHVEWSRYGEGPWNYEKNQEKLREFWREGIERMGDNESMVTIGMRGDGDEPMTEGTAISLLEKIVHDQREIIAEVTGKPASETPQSWALYKEVQDYYDKGMDVPEDVMLLYCDDNWGNIRRLPPQDKRNREGGYGIYYHFDYVGDPRNYKWLNTNQIERTWEQMHLAWKYGARKLWLVNVGDIKAMEFPISFFLDYAWDPEGINADDLPAYYTSWAQQQFGPGYAEEIGNILAKYTKYNSRRKPELLSPETYSLHNYREAERIVIDYNELLSKAEYIEDALPEEYKDAFFQLVIFPVKACANLNELYVTAAKNRLYAKQGRSLTNDMAKKTEELFIKDSLITEYYHNEVAGGKWNHIASQTHIGYTYWQEPPYNNMPEVSATELADAPDMGIALEGSEKYWPANKGNLQLPEFDPLNKQEYYIEIFNRGKGSFKYEAKPGTEWININPANGEVSDQSRIKVSINWSKVPNGNHQVPLNVNAGTGQKAEILLNINNSSELTETENVRGFIENNGVISIEAEHYSTAFNSDSIHWLSIPNLGRTGSSVTTFPVTSNPKEPGNNSPYLEYDIFLFEPGEVTVKAYLCPTLNFTNQQGFRYAVSIDDEKTQIVNMHKDYVHQDWQRWVRNNANVCESKHMINTAGHHKLKYWMVDPAVVLQKIVVERKPARGSYLGPPESMIIE